MKKIINTKERIFGGLQLWQYVVVMQLAMNILVHVMENVMDIMDVLVTTHNMNMTAYVTKLVTDM